LGKFEIEDKKANKKWAFVKIAQPVQKGPKMEVITGILRLGKSYDYK